MCAETPQLAHLFCSLSRPFCFMYGRCPALNNIKAQRSKPTMLYLPVRVTCTHIRTETVVISFSLTFLATATTCAVHYTVFCTGLYHAWLFICICVCCTPVCCCLWALDSLWVLATASGLGGGVKGLLPSMSFKQPSLSLLAPHSFSHSLQL